MHVQPRVLCGRCNGTWMSSIEQTAAPAVAQMVRGESMALGAETQRAVAAWSLAVSILRAELVPGGHSFDRAAAYAFREHGLEAVDIGIWAVNVDLTQRGLLGGAATTYVRGEADGVEGAVALIWLRRVCFIIAHEPYRSRFERSLRGIAPAVARLPSNDGLPWPPGRTVADSTLLEVLELGELLTPEFLDMSGAAPGRFTEQVLSINERVPANDLAHEVMARRLAAATEGPWPQPLRRDDDR